MKQLGESCIIRLIIMEYQGISSLFMCFKSRKEKGMGELKKRYFTKMTAWMLVFMLAFSFVPTDAFAAGAAKDITVYMTVSDKGVIAKTKDGEAMAWKEVTVKDLDKSGDFTYDEALKAAHSAYNKEDGYSADSTGWVSAVWGIQNNPGSYYFTKNGMSSLSNHHKIIEIS